MESSDARIAIERVVQRSRQRPPADPVALVHEVRAGLGAEVRETWRDLAALGVVLYPFDLAHDDSEIAAVIACLRRRHATDSSYICLAQHLETEVRTLDGALARNAADVGLPVKLVS